MKALVLKDYRLFEHIDLPEPEISDDEVLLRIKAVAICGSDVHGYDGTSGRRKPPIIIGHEAAGEIALIGRSVTGWNIGDRVTFDSTLSCGKCENCKSGRVNICSDRKVFGVSCDKYACNGAMAEYLNVPARLLYKLPDNLDYEYAALTEPLAVALHAINRTDIKLGDKVVVIGAGTIGLLLIKLLRLSSSTAIVVCDTNENRLETAKKCGADICLNANTGIKDQLLALYSEGVDVVFEAVGISQTVKDAISCAKVGGIVTMLGNISKQIEFPLQETITKELVINSSCALAGEYKRCIELMSSGKIALNDIISKIAPLKNGAEWFDKLHDNPENLIKVVLTV